MSSTEGVAVTKLESLSPIDTQYDTQHGVCRSSISSWDRFMDRRHRLSQYSRGEWTEEDDVHSPHPTFPSGPKPSSWCSLGKRTDRAHLVSGYTRSHISPYLGTEIVSNLILKFYDLVAYWDFDSLDTFEKSKFRHILRGPRFRFHDLVFQCTLCPRGWSHKDCIQFYVEFDKEAMKNQLPVHVRSVTCYLVIYCEQIEYEYRTPKTFTNVQSAQGWPAYRIDDVRLRDFDSLNFGCYIELLEVNTLSLRGMDRALGGPVGAPQSCSNPMSPMSASMSPRSPMTPQTPMTPVLGSNRISNLTSNLNSNQFPNPLSALGPIGIDRMESGDSPQSPQHRTTKQHIGSIPNISNLPRTDTLYDAFLNREHRMASTSRSEWFVTGDLLRKFKAAKHSQGFYSPNFDDGSWCLSCSPNGIKREYDGQFCIALKLLRLPYGVTAAKVRHSIHIRSDDAEFDIDLDAVKVFNYKRKASRFNLAIEDSWSFEHAKWLRIAVEVHVEEEISTKRTDNC